MTSDSAGTHAAPSRGSGLRAKLGCIAPLLLVALSVYLMSYSIVRTITVGSFLRAEDASYVTFDYPGGGGHIYPSTKEGAKFLFLLAEVAGPDGVLPLPFVDPAPDEKAGESGPDWSWFCVVYVPLERLELFCRGYGSVRLTEEEKAAARKEVDSIIMPW